MQQQQQQHPIQWDAYWIYWHKEGKSGKWFCGTAAQLQDAEKNLWMVCYTDKSTQVETYDESWIPVKTHPRCPKGKPKILPSPLAAQPVIQQPSLALPFQTTPHLDSPFPETQHRSTPPKLDATTLPKSSPPKPSPIPPPIISPIDDGIPPSFVPKPRIHPKPSAPTTPNAVPNAAPTRRSPTTSSPSPKPTLPPPSSLKTPPLTKPLTKPPAAPHSPSSFQTKSNVAPLLKKISISPPKPVLKSSFLTSAPPKVSPVSSSTRLPLTSSPKPPVQSLSASIKRKAMDNSDSRPTKKKKVTSDETKEKMTLKTATPLRDLFGQLYTGEEPSLK